MPSTPHDLAQDSFNAVRGTWYRDRGVVHKSSNKAYDESSIGTALASWASGRNALRQTAHTELDALRGEVQSARTAKTLGPSMVAEGDFIIKQASANSDRRAFNCQELAAICLAIAKYRLGADDDQLYWASLQSPGDHAFALFGPLASMQAINNTAIVDFKRLRFGADPEPWIADVWLNTCCSVTAYPERAAAKLEKWQHDCKRIWWSGTDGKQPGWWNTAGEYKFAFLRCKVTVRMAA